MKITEKSENSENEETLYSVANQSRNPKQSNKSLSLDFVIKPQSNFQIKILDSDPESATPKGGDFSMQTNASKIWMKRL